MRAHAKWAPANFVEVSAEGQLYDARKRHIRFAEWLVGDEAALPTLLQE